MSNGNLSIWDAVRQPPKDALTTIKGGRLKGMTDIKPQWRYQAMTAQFGPCGIGWKYTVNRLWTEKGVGDELMAFADVSLYVRVGNASDEAVPGMVPVWSDPIPGIGGSAMIALESSGPRASDECYKMAITDALSVAMKMLGVGADIYMGRWDGGKYAEPIKEVGGEASKSVAKSELDRVKKDNPDLYNTMTNAMRQIAKALAEDRGYDALELYSTMRDSLEASDQVAFWGLFDSTQRSALKAFGQQAKERVE